jgi:hypothetical protein
LDGEKEEKEERTIEAIVERAMCRFVEVTEYLKNEKWGYSIDDGLLACNVDGVGHLHGSSCQDH